MGSTDAVVPSPVPDAVLEEVPLDPRDVAAVLAEVVDPRSEVEPDEVEGSVLL